MMCCLNLQFQNWKIKPATTPHPPLPTISQLTYAAQQVGGLFEMGTGKGT